MLRVQNVKFKDVTTEYIRGKPFLNRRSIPLTQKALVEKIGQDSVVAKVQSAVPRIRLELDEGRRTIAYGSGVLISPDGIGLSNFHIYNHLLNKEAFCGSRIHMYADIPVLTDSPVPDWMRNGKVKVVTVDGSPVDNDDTKISVFTVPIAVLGKDLKNDLMLFSIQPDRKHESFQFAEITDELPILDEVYYALGHPNRKRHVSLVAGEIENTSYDFSDWSPSGQKRCLKMISLDDGSEISHVYGSICGNHRTAHGYSGGALCDNEGKVLGINSLGHIVMRNPVLEYLIPFFPNITSDPKFAVIKSSYFQGTRDKVIPFLRCLGINIGNILAGKPLKGQDAVQKLLRKQPAEELACALSFDERPY